MIPLRLTRQSAPVEAYELRRHNLFEVVGWLRGTGYRVDVHVTHGLLIESDAGPVTVDYGQWVTLSNTGRVEVWDKSELVAEHDGPEETG